MYIFRRLFAASLFIVPLVFSAHAADTPVPSLLYFGASWCAACETMEREVLSRPGFARLSSGFRLKREDVDTREGAALKAKYLAFAIPTFILVDADGAEIGRIIGQQQEPRFLAKLAALLRRRSHART